MKIAIVGCGAITRFRHAPECTQNPAVELSGFFDVNPQRALELAGQYHAHCYKSYQEILQNSEIDAVILCTPNFTHAKDSIEALKAGKHVLCEKPMAVNVREGIEMSNTAASCGKLLMIAQNQRFHPAHQKAKSLLKDHVLGRILTFRSEFSHGGPENWGIDHSCATWFFKKDKSTIGSMGDLGVHKIDLLRWMLGEEFVQVTAQLCVRDKTLPDGSPIEVDDNALCILTTASGIMGTVISSWTNYANSINETVIFCEKGIMTVKNEDNDSSVCLDYSDGRKELYQFPPCQSSGVVDAFVNAILAGEQSPVSGEDGVNTLRTVFAAMDSSKKGVTVKISHTN